MYLNVVNVEPILQAIRVSVSQIGADDEGFVETTKRLCTLSP
jgi:hypothetical protein